MSQPTWQPGQNWSGSSQTQTPGRGPAPLYLTKWTPLVWLAASAVSIFNWSFMSWYSTAKLYPVYPAAGGMYYEQSSGQEIAGLMVYVVPIVIITALVVWMVLRSQRITKREGGLR